MRRCRINLPNRCQRLISRAEWHTARLKGASGESKGSRRYDKENLLWQFTVAIRSDPVGSVGSGLRGGVREIVLNRLPLVGYYFFGVLFPWKGIGKK